MHVVVTGGAGFIGAALTNELTARGAKTTVIDDLSHACVDLVDPAATVRTASVASRRAVEAAFPAHVDCVIHAAAMTSVAACERLPDESSAVNVLGARNVIEASVASGCRRLVFLSSGGAIYGDRVTQATEASTPRPLGLYGKQKLKSERAMLNADLPCAIVRLSNVYGPPQVHYGQGVVPALIAATNARAPFTVNGTGRQTRDFVYVDDAVAAILDVMDRGAGHVWNVCSGASTSVLDLLRTFEAVVDRPVPFTFGALHRWDVDFSKMSNAKAKNILGWHPNISLSTGLKRCIEYAVPPPPPPQKKRP